MSDDLIPLPDTANLNEIAKLVAGCNFEQLIPEHRVIILQLAIDNERNAILGGIETELQPIANWFNKSKVYWP